MAYFANGAEGMKLEEQCAECPFGEEPCEVALAHLLYNYDQVEEGQDKLRNTLRLLVNDDGECSIKKRLDTLRIIRPVP